MGTDVPRCELEKGEESAIRGGPVSRAEQEQEERPKPRGAPAERNGGRSLRWVWQAQPPPKRLSVLKTRLQRARTVEE